MIYGRYSDLSVDEIICADGRVVKNRAIFRSVVSFFLCSYVGCLISNFVLNFCLLLFPLELPRDVSV